MVQQSPVVTRRRDKTQNLRGLIFEMPWSSSLFPTLCWEAFAQPDKLSVPNFLPFSDTLGETATKGVASAGEAGDARSA